MSETMVVETSEQQAAVSPAQFALGELTMDFADELTEFRAKSAKPFAVVIALTDESWDTTFAIGGSMATDAGDGFFARLGARVAGHNKTRPEGAKADPAADKDLVNGLMLGLIGRFIRQKRFGSAAVVGANYLVTQRRDKKMGNDRALVESHDLDRDALKAIKINKAKTAVQFAALLELVSPAAKNKEARLAGLALLSSGTGVGWVGQKKYRKKVEDLIAAKQATKDATAWRTE